MAIMSTLIERVRLELGDLGKSFVETIVSDGSTNRFQLQYQPLNSESVKVSINGTDVTDVAHVEESAGVVVLADTVVTPGDTPVIPDAGSVLTFNGIHYRYFTDSEMEHIISTAISEHSAKHTDSLGRPMAIGTLPTIEEYPVAVYATVIALYTLATDAAFDIDIMAPDGVSIPRSERYRQLMQMIQMRQDHYRDLCVQLGIGLYSIDVFSLRRISKTTNRYVPVYKPQEVDDRSIAQRAELNIPTYGDNNVPWITEDKGLLAYQDVAFADTVTFSGDWVDYSFIARIVLQRGSIQRLQTFAMDLTEVSGNYTADISLTRDQTIRLPGRSWWQIVSVNPDTQEEIEIIGGDFFVRKSYTSIL